jgi:hypothetical protein
MGVDNTRIIDMKETGVQAVKVKTTSGCYRQPQEACA